jgi:thymidylate synthase
MMRVDGPEITKNYIENNAPEEEHNTEDHLPNLLEQIQREEREWPTLDISEDATIDNISRDDIVLNDYDPHPSLRFYVAE